MQPEWSNVWLISSVIKISALARCLFCYINERLHLDICIVNRDNFRKSVLLWNLFNDKINLSIVSSFVEREKRLNILSVLCKMWLDVRYIHCSIVNWSIKYLRANAFVLIAYILRLTYSYNRCISDFFFTYRQDISDKLARTVYWYKD